MTWLCNAEYAESKLRVFGLVSVRQLVTWNANARQVPEPQSGSELEFESERPII